MMADRDMKHAFTTSSTAHVRNTQRLTLPTSLFALLAGLDAAKCNLSKGGST